jgi:hypothetical protein
MCQIWRVGEKQQNRFKLIKEAALGGHKLQIEKLGLGIKV